MSYLDLRDFLQQLEKNHQLKRITLAVDPYLEMTEICDRTLRKNGPALLFENPKGYKIPVLGNLFGSVERIALSIGKKSLQEIRELGLMLAYLRAPEPPKGLKELLKKLPLFRQVLHMNPKIISNPPVQEHVLEGNDVDLYKLPIQTCWPEDAGPLITWGLVTTHNPSHLRQNVGIYRQQVIGKNQVIMRWLAHRGGALDFQEWQKLHPKEKFPIAVSLGADPATLIAAVLPIPDNLSEYAFAGLLRGEKTLLAKCHNSNLHIPAYAEYVLEGYLQPGFTAPEGPFGDHTGYYNEVESFPVFTIEKITHRSNPLYHSTYTGKPPDEPAILGVALNELFIPLLQQQFPEIVDFYLPPEGCSYRVAVVTFKKKYLGHAKRIMLGIWSILQQFMYTKWIIAVDDDINARDWKEVIWAMSTRMDPRRDTLILDNTPIDYLDFASPISGLGSKIGFDATHKWPGETERVWGKPIQQAAHIKKQVDDIWPLLDIFSA